MTIFLDDYSLRRRQRREVARMVAAQTTVFLGCLTAIIIAQWPTLISSGIFGSRDGTALVGISPASLSLTIFLPLIFASTYPGRARLVCIAVLSCALAVLNVSLEVGAGFAPEWPPIILEAIATIGVLTIGFVGSRRNSGPTGRGSPALLWTLILASSLWMPVSTSASPLAWYLLLGAVAVAALRFPIDLDSPPSSSLVRDAFRGGSAGLVASALIWAAERL